ncbi:surfactant protein Ba [Brachyhypopomus gauderio]|uniref:surfactant protein Ba n=1 Tax=Brachyhypopomus gauderio TaxID=698409 RepID=UPI004041C44F
MASLKLAILLFLPLLGTAKPRFVDDENMQDVDMSAGEALDDDTCQDCKQIIELLKHLMSDQQFQAKLKDSLEEMCESLPGEMARMCQEQIEQNFALALTFLGNLMMPDEVCAYLGLCDGVVRDQFQDFLMDHMHKTIRMSTFSIRAAVPCTVCRYVMNVMEYFLPKAQTEAVVTGLLGQVCGLLPTVMQGQCTRMIQKYVHLLIEILLNSASPNSICNLLRLCQGLETAAKVSPAVSAVSDCDSCLTLAVLSRLHLGSNASRLQAASFLHTVCQSYPGVLQKCEHFTQRYGNQLQGILGKEEAALDICERADMCARKEPFFGDDPCSMGPSYSCRDLQTAERCGVVSFCKGNAWD